MRPSPPPCGESNRWGRRTAHIRMSNSHGLAFSRLPGSPRCEQVSPPNMRGGGAPAGAGCGGWSTIRIAANRGACGRATAAIFRSRCRTSGRRRRIAPPIPASYRRSPAPRAAAKRRSPVVGPDGVTRGSRVRGDTSSPARRRRLPPHSKTPHEAPLANRMGLDYSLLRMLSRTVMKNLRHN